MKNVTWKKCLNRISSGDFSWARQKTYVKRRGFTLQGRTSGHSGEKNEGVRDGWGVGVEAPANGKVELNGQKKGTEKKGAKQPTTFAATKGGLHGSW